MAKRYNQYCPVAHALDVVGERWTLLLVRELNHGPLRYTDLHERVGCGTNILAARLRDLEENGVVRKRRLPPPAASVVYELTESGEGLRPVLHALGWWGIRLLGPPPPDVELHPGWLPGALQMAVWGAPVAGRIEFRVAGEVATVDREGVRPEPAGVPDTIVETDPTGFYHLFVDQSFDAVEVTGDREPVERLLAALPTGPPLPAAV
jgi:DNA-binding HxlR family transcriptional regulator